jgi:hypothetical protein
MYCFLFLERARTDGTAEVISLNLQIGVIPASLLYSVKAVSLH